MIRKATRADWQAISDISMRSGYVDYINREGISFLSDGEVLVVDEGKILAFSKIEYLSDGSAWLSGLRVDPDFWRKGLGRQLTEESLAMAGKKGSTCARMLVYEDNEKSLGLARKLGFREVSRYYFYHGLPETDNFMSGRYKVVGYVNVGWKYVYYERNKPGDFHSLSYDGWHLIQTRDDTIQILEPGRNPMEIGSENGFTCVETKKGEKPDNPFTTETETSNGLVLELKL